jgi:cysteinyl-tRNA synthetase
LIAELEQAKKDLDAALRNSFDTPGAMQVILRLVKDANIYMNDKSAQPSLQAVEAVARWVTKIVGILGLDASARPPYNGLGWASASAAAAANLDPQTAVKPYVAAYARVKANVEGLRLGPSIQTLLQQQAPDAEFAELEKSGERDVEKLAMPYLRATSRLRDELRAIVSAVEPAMKQSVLALSDHIRDYDLTDLGVQLDDQTDKPSLIKFVDAAKLIAARDEKAALLAEKTRQKEEGMSCSAFAHDHR